jgi:hypothetical protein
MFNAPCCSHRGHRPDTRMRGNLRFGEDGTIGGNCYNCGHKFRFDGTTISDSFANWLSWIGVSNREIQEIKIQLLALQLEGKTSVNSLPAVQTRWEPVSLPPDSVHMDVLKEEGLTDPNFIKVKDYLTSRGHGLATGYDYYWTPNTKHALNQRVIIPFWHKEIIVGYTARYAGTPPPGVPRYWNSEVPAGYLFNQNVLQLNRQFVIIVEGPFDAIAVQGVATLGSKISDAQIHAIELSGREPVVLPDRQATNQNLIDVAQEFGWSVSFPDWEPHIKDAADACKSYGQIYTITSALAARTNNSVAIGVKRQMLGRTLV